MGKEKLTRQTSANNSIVTLKIYALFPLLLGANCVIAGAGSGPEAGNWRPLPYMVISMKTSCYGACTIG